MLKPEGTTVPYREKSFQYLISKKDLYYIKYIFLTSKSINYLNIYIKLQIIPLHLAVAKIDIFNYEDIVQFFLYI